MILRVTFAEAQARLPELARRVRAGETVVIDVDGAYELRLGGADATPAAQRPAAERDRLRAEIEAFRAGHTLGLDWQDLRDSGRRF